MFNKPKKISILNSNKHQLVGNLYKNTSKTIMIMCPGMQSFSDFSDIEKIYEAYYKTGSSVFVFDFTGYGESEGKKTMSIKQKVCDVNSIVDHFSKDYEEIILYGISMSGVVVAIAAAKNKKITKLLTINGLLSLHPKNLHHWQVYYLLTHPQLWFEIVYWKKNFKVENISIPVLVVYGENDKIVNPRQSIDFYEKLKTRKSFVAIPDGDHALMKKEYEKVTIAAPNWVKQQVIY